MTETGNKLILLMADDDEDDRLMAKDALDEAAFVNPIFFVEDGEELMDFLYRRGQYKSEGRPVQPGLILLDLNMPKKDGREALKEIKGNPELRKIPVVILTTSKAEEDIFSSYDLGANSYIIKPDTFKSLVEIMKDVKRYWFGIVELP